MSETPTFDTDVSPSWRVTEVLHTYRYWLLGLFLILLAVLLREALLKLAQDLDYAAIVAAIHDTPPRQLGAALLAVAVSYFALTGYDWSALRYAKVSLPYWIVAQTSFIAYALGNSIGVGVLTGGAVRMRLYGAAGVDAGKVSHAIAFNALAFGLGITIVGAAALLWGAKAVAGILSVPTLLLQVPAALVIIATVFFLGVCYGGRALRIRTFSLRLPGAELVLHQLAYSIVDIVASAAVLWLLLPSGAVPFAPFVAFYAIAIVLGVLSHVPGGLGVFDSILLLALGRAMPTETLAGALLLYRLLYYAVPLTLSLVLLVVHEARRGVAAPIGRAAARLSPKLLAAFTLVVGIMLLVSGATPATDEAAALLELHVPLVLVEASHFLGSIAGLALLFVARGMLQRLDVAWWAGIVIAGISAVLALPKGLAVSEAVVLGFLVVTLALSRKQFSRRARLLAPPFSVGWWLAVVTILIAVASLLLFAYRDVEYTHELWWQFEFDAHAPRSLRAFVAVAVLVAGLAWRQLLRPPAPPMPLPDDVTLGRVEVIVRGQDIVDAGLALMGDKHILFSESGNAFVMFGRRGRSWIALFDPIGPATDREELVWHFLERAVDAGARASFYQVRPQYLPLYLDAGLRLFKLGEYAHIPLADFSLQGRKRGNLRTGVNRGAREGLVFEWIPREAVPTLIPTLTAISDAWLAEHRAAEKAFSLGAFNPRYLCRQPIALVRKGDQPLAFATLLLTDHKAEASVDLMRHLPDVPPGTMDFLFANTLLFLKEAGYQRFGLGMAPLSGMAHHPLAPRWHRVGRLLYTHGEHFYNFQGLRAFKEKFAPVWEPRYLAAPGGVQPLLVLSDVAALIGGGLPESVQR